MGDPRRFWKEAVGAPPQERHAPQPSPPAATATPPVPPPLPEGSTAAGLLPVDQALAALPVGSVVFGDQVAKTFWAAPSPADLKALAAIAERRRFIPAGVQRDAVLRAVLARQRVQRLVAPAHRPICDARPFHLRSAEWSRLAQLTGQTLEELKANPEGPNAEALLAARGLLPDVLDLEAEAAVATEAALLIEAGLAGKHSDGAAAFSAFSEAAALLDAIQTGRSAPGDVLFLEILAGCSLARRALNASARDQVERARRATSRLVARLDRSIDQAMKEHKRDPEQNKKLAHWRRHLLETQKLVDEVLARAAGPAPRAPAPTRTPATGPPPRTAQSDKAMLEHLRQVQRKVGGAAEPQAAPDKPKKGWRRWFSR